MPTKYNSYFIALLSAALLCVAWLYIPVLVFVALVPLLFLEDKLSKQKRQPDLNLSTLLAFFSWNICTTSWISMVSMGGFLLIATTNAMLMSLVFALFSYTKKHLGNKRGYIALVVYWLCFEWLHEYWAIAWPWLHFGNVFAFNTSLIQWYSFTGVSGGSLWVLLCNIAAFKALKYMLLNESKKRLIPFAFLLFIPMLVSLLIDNIEYKSVDKKTAVLFQTDINPYSAISPDSTFLDLQQMLTDAPQADVYILPENAIPVLLNKDFLPFSEEFLLLQSFVKSGKTSKLICGLSTANKADIGIQLHNAALVINKDLTYELICKQHLVPGMEREIFPAISNFFIGNINRSLTSGLPTDISENTQAVLICYESVFGKPAINFSSKNNTFIAVITNDAWWGTSIGRKQHLHYARLRAIENGKYVLRAANGGVSAVINPKGEIDESYEKAESGLLTMQYTENHHETFFAKHGNILGRISLLFSPLFLLFALVKARTNK
jgi:apolipoprotein N-acyltransferase